jgi:hypothetical protein
VEYGHWDVALVGEFNPDDHLGFVYQITNTENGKSYIGCKHLWRFSKGKRVKASAWQNYCGSSKYLSEDIEGLGKDKFSFQILMLCDNKRNLYYNEIKMQVELGVLESDKYYNANIGGIRFYRPVKSYYTDKLRGYFKGIRNPAYKGPFLVTFAKGHTVRVVDVTMKDWCASSGLTPQRISDLRTGKRDSYKGIVKVEYESEIEKD